MGRPERQLDPAAGPVEQFARQLRDLRVRAGRPAYRRLAAVAHYSHTTLSRAAAGHQLPTLPVVLAFAVACGGDPQEWTERWQAAASRQPAAGRPGHRRGSPAAASMRARIQAHEDRTYTGRQAEIRRVLALLADPGRLPGVVSVHGPPGIGKTAFGCAAGRTWAAEAGGPSVTIDSRDFSHDPGGLTAAVRQRCQPWPRPAASPALLLVIDTWEELDGAAPGPGHEFIRELRGPVLVMAAGRRPAAGLPGQAAWQPFSEEIRLEGLTRSESRTLLGRLGVTRESDITAAASFARGNPLLLTIAAGLASTGPPGTLAEACRAPGISRNLIATMTREIRNPGVRRLLEAASVVRTANEELLAAITAADVAAEFAALCELSIVRIVAQGIRVHDVIRQAVAADLRWRSPATYDRWRERACRYLRDCGPSDGPGWQHQELLYLLHDPATAAATVTPWTTLDAYAADPDIQIRPARGDELPALLDLCRRGESLEGISRDLYLRELDEGLATAGGACLLATRKHTGPVAVSYALPLTSRTWQRVSAAREY